MSISQLKWPLIGVGALAALCLLFMMIAPSFVDSQKIADEIGHEVEALTGRKMIYGDVSVSMMFGAYVKVHGIAIKNDEEGSANYFLRADGLVINLDFFDAIFSDKPTVTSMDLEAPKLNLERLSSGRNNWSFLQGDHGLGSNVSGVTLNITHGTVAYTHHKEQWVEDIKGVSGKIDLSQRQMSFEANGINRDIHYKWSGICYTNSYEHLGSLDAECSSILTSNLFSLDYKGRVIVADGAFRHKGTMNATTADARAWL
ncbi:MAG: hypothetical protein MRY32_04925, partial [Rickettsiales bacterium]|nr:hypothetical protein [Rickettsiales bacterium]